MPALILAQADSNRGVLMPEKRVTVADGIGTMLDNLSDDFDEKPSVHAAATGKALCVAARNELDEAGARSLKHLLRSEGHEALASLSVATLAEVNRQPFALRGAALVCLSMISTRSATHARYIMRWMRRRAPQARLLIGIWVGHPANLTPTDEHRQICGGCHLAARGGSRNCRYFGERT